MRALMICALILCAQTLSFPAYADKFESGQTTTLNEDVRCYEDSALKQSWDYCITQTANSANRDVVYYLHGLGTDEYLWLQWQQNIKIRKYWKDNNIQAPTVVSVSFGRVWLLAEQNASKHSGLFELFTEVVIPRIEKKLTLSNGRRILMGISMGGFNTSQVMLKKPELFQKYVLGCPIITNISHFSTEDEIVQYAEDNNADPIRLIAMILIARRYYPDRYSWDNSWQLKLAPKTLSMQSPPFYISAGKYDEYGIYNSVVMFKDIAIQNGAPVEWESIEGDHCDGNPVSMAEYLVK